MGKNTYLKKYDGPVLSRSKRWITGLICTICLAGSFGIEHPGGLWGIAGIGLLAILTRSGILIDQEGQRLMMYTTFGGVYRQGKWRSIKRYRQVTMLRKTRSYESGGTLVMPIIFFVNSSKVDQLYFDIVLLDDTHLRKITVASYEDREAALAEVKLLAAQLNIQITRFRPQRLRQRD